ncbi:uncharacterized protein N7529_004326 [Penicillium soppii]|uniref:uncharacterized protein n=1 Tax=Penicillium soppii TaxID=69789 RepID=UPI00254949F7|nr:uncharacterized protein N7529_004326 [Penicillium soppii]KAJ5871973.1 hypothetical protein N7529_004326 [Penicillium soppii]
MSISRLQHPNNGVSRAVVKDFAIFDPAHAAHARGQMKYATNTASYPQLPIHDETESTQRRVCGA